MEASSDAPQRRPPPVRPPVPSEQLFAYATYTPSKSPTKPSRARRRECSACGATLAPNAPWFCAGDAIYCSQSCRMPNLPFAQGGSKDGKRSSGDRQHRRSASGGAVPEGPASAAGGRARGAEAPVQHAPHIVPAEYHGPTVPDLSGSPSFDVGRRPPPEQAPLASNTPILGDSPHNSTTQLSS